MSPSPGKLAKKKKKCVGEILCSDLPGGMGTLLSLGKGVV